MTSLTSSEIKTIYFGIVFFIVIGALAAFYNQSPIPNYSYQGETSISSASSASFDPETNWISSLVSALPSPFDDVGVALVTSIFVTPVALFLAYIAVRALKDLITQWL